MSKFQLMAIIISTGIYTHCDIVTKRLFKTNCVFFSLKDSHHSTLFTTGRQNLLCNTK